MSGRGVRAGPGRRGQGGAARAAGRSTGYLGHEEGGSNLFYASYSFVTDDTGNKRGLSHEFDIGKGFDLQPFGIVGASVYASLYDCETLPAGSDDGLLQEVDYTVYWTQGIAPLSLRVEVGYMAQTFPQLSGDAFFTNEFYLLLALDDRPLFKTKQPVLNPYVVVFWDTDNYPGARSEMGISHVFTPEDLGTLSVPVLERLLVVPQIIASFDHGQIQSGTRLTDLRYGALLSLDLAPLVHLPNTWGRLSLDLFVYYRDWHVDGFQDRVYGGVSVGWAY